MSYAPMDFPTAGDKSGKKKKKAKGGVGSNQYGTKNSPSHSFSDHANATKKLNTSRRESMKTKISVENAKKHR